MVLLLGALALLITFSAGLRDMDALVLTLGTAVASIASVAGVRAVQAEFSRQAPPGLEAVLAQQTARRGKPAVPAPLAKIISELELAAGSRRYYRSVVDPRLRQLIAGLEPEQRARAEADIQRIGTVTDSWRDRLPERLSRRGVNPERIATLVDHIKSTLDSHGTDRAPSIPYRS